MKKIGNVICTVLLILGAIVAIIYGTHKEENTAKEMYGGNGVVVTDVEGNKAYIQYFDIGKTEKSRENKRKVYAGVGFCIYSIAVIGGRYFVTLRRKTIQEINKMENNQGDDFLL